MDVWLLGAAAIVLIAITLWIVWPSRGAEAAAEPNLPDTVAVAPDEFTSATADLSAGGVATTIGEPERPTPPATVAALSTLDTPQPQPSAPRVPLPESRQLALPPKPEPSRGKQVGLGAAALLALGGGALFFFARWRQGKRKKPMNRLRRLVR